MSYSRPDESAEYGGGGRGSDNYYNSNNDFQGDGGGSFDRQGGPQYNTGNGSGNGNSSGGGYGNDSYGGGGYESNDWTGAQQHAESHAGESGNSSMFSSVLSHLQNNAGQIQQQDNIDEGQAIQAHQKLYGGQGGESHSSQSLGAGAAMQALKMFTSQGQGQGSGLGGKQQFVGMAMAEASKLFDQKSVQGNVSASASKQNAVTAAGEMAMKMYLKSQMGGGGSGLMGLASKFL